MVTVVLVALTSAAMWPRDDVPMDPDAVVVLGGSPAERTDLGLELRDRYGAQLVLPPSAVDYAHSRGIECGVDAICIRPVPDSTAGEARLLARLTADHGWEHVTVATTRFHTTRARVLFSQCLGDDVSVVGAPRAQGRRVGVLKHLREVAATGAALTTQRRC